MRPHLHLPIAHQGPAETVRRSGVKVLESANERFTHNVEACFKSVGCSSAGGLRKLVQRESVREAHIKVKDVNDKGREKGWC